MSSQIAPHKTKKEKTKSENSRKKKSKNEKEQKTEGASPDQEPEWVYQKDIVVLGLICQDILSPTNYYWVKWGLGQWAGLFQ